MAVETSFNFAKSLRSYYKTPLSGRAPTPLNKIEDAFNAEANKKTIADHVTWGHLGLLSNVIFGVGGGYGFKYFEGSFLKFASALIGVTSALSAIGNLAVTLTGKHPVIEEMNALMTKNIGKHATSDVDSQRLIKVNMADYAAPEEIQERVKDAISLIDQRGTFINVCGIKGVGKSFLSRCFAGEVHKETGRKVHLWNLNIEELGSNVSDELSSIPFLKNFAGEKRTAKLERVIAYACEQVQKSMKDGKPTEHVVIALDEIGGWLGPLEWSSGKGFNSADPRSRSEISNELNKIIDKLFSEKGIGVTLVLMSNASIKQMSDPIKDRTNPHQFINPDEKLRADYYEKVLNGKLKEKGFTTLTKEQISELAAIGTHSILDQVKRSHSAYEKIDGTEFQKQELLENYNHLSFRSLDENIVNPVLAQSKSTNEAFPELVRRIQKEFDASLAESRWKNEIAQQYNFDNHYW
jgi:energy-coupling factor transporter ATP-binding protein EcfA2